jgi:glycosyltransferase involved in cell wall biosynthesis
MKSQVDVCLILEGSYPFVQGGVSTWMHEVIEKQPHLTFHIVALLPRDDEPKMLYELPSNVKGLTKINLMRLPKGASLSDAEATRMFDKLRTPLINLTTSTASLNDLETMIQAIKPYSGKLGSAVMLDSQAAWKLTTDMYETSFSESSMLDYFWSWRAVMGGLYSLMIADLPVAKCYHAMSTGYAGIFAARAKIETGKPVLLTEHGIYTNERRIEISSADWLEETASKTLTIDETRRNLRDLWSHTFAGYSRIAYQAADKIITLFAGNQAAQLNDGADKNKMMIIPNGVDVERYGQVGHRTHTQPTVALIGRVVPIKDIKTFLRAIAALKQNIEDLRVFILGPMDEDPEYAEDCKQMVEYFALQKTVTFTGRVRIEDYMPEIDVLVFSSISEAQPLTILEVGANGIPTVATDVGACREMILGMDNETPALGAGGVVAPLSNPQALAQGIYKLLSDADFYESCSSAMRKRVQLYYNKNDQHEAYRALYAACMK